MKKQIILTIILSILILIACNFTPAEPTPIPNTPTNTLQPLVMYTQTDPTPTPISGTPTNTHQPLIMWTQTHTPSPSNTPSPTQPTAIPSKTLSATPFSAAITLDDEPIQPGIYPAFFREGSIYIDIPAAGTLELLHLYDEPVHKYPDGSSTGLNAYSGDTIASPHGKYVTHMNGIDGIIYNYDLQTKTIQAIPQPDPGSMSMPWHGQWSPDGKYIAYSLNDIPYDIGSIYIADIQNDTFSRISHWDWVESNPVWSPDFQRIAYDSDIGKLDDQGQILDELKNSPDFQQGIYVGSTDIFVMSAVCITDVGTCLDAPAKQLTHTGINGKASHPQWRPNGIEIAYIGSDDETDGQDIYLVDLDGNTTNLTNTPENSELYFDWSPDSDQMVILIESEKSETDLYILNLTDGTTTKITDSPYISEGIPFWSPDGEEIAFKENSYNTAAPISIYSVIDHEIHTLNNSENSNFLFWLKVFPEITRGTTLYVSPAGEGTHIRSQSSINGAILGQLHAGDAFTITGEYSGDNRYSWWRITSTQGDGWILQNYNWYMPE